MAKKLHDVDTKKLNSMIHVFKIFSDIILLDAASGTLHIIDELTADILQSGGLDKNNVDISLLSKYPLQEIENALDELQELYEADLIFTDDETAVSSCGEQGEVKAICLNIAHACNLSCRYCFACEGAYGGETGLMSPETARQAIDFLITASRRRKHIEVDFFGGEPLLAWDTVIKTVEYGRKAAKDADKKIKFTLTTNAVGLTDEIIKFLNENEMSVVLSLDGRKETHDRMRSYADGGGTYDDVLDSISRFVSSRGQKEYFVRGTYTSFNLDFAEDIKHIVDKGFQLTSVEPVVGDPKNEWTLAEKDLERIKAEYKKLTALYMERKKEGHPFSFFHFNIDLENGPCSAKRASGCGAGSQYLAVDASGRLFPCHQFVGKDEFCMGDVRNGVGKQELGNAFRASNIYSKEDCRNCWARYFCGGGCHANAWFANADIRKPYRMGCLLEQTRLECALAIKAEELKGE